MFGWPDYSVICRSRHAGNKRNVPRRGGKITDETHSFYPVRPRGCALKAPHTTPPMPTRCPGHAASAQCDPDGQTAGSAFIGPEQEPSHMARSEKTPGQDQGVRRVGISAYSSSQPSALRVPRGKTPGVAKTCTRAWRQLSSELDRRAWTGVSAAFGADALADVLAGLPAWPGWRWTDVASRSLSGMGCACVARIYDPFCLVARRGGDG